MSLQDENQHVPSNQNDEWVLTFLGAKPAYTIEVYRQANGAIYHKILKTGEIRGGSPDFAVYNGMNISHKYHPAQLVFTGARSGNVAMGGFHTTEAYISERTSSSEKGYINVESQDLSFFLERIEISGAVKAKYKRDTWLNSICKDNTILCYDLEGALRAQDYTSQIMASSTNFMSKTDAISNALNNKCLSAKDCKRIADFLNDVISGNFPLDDAELYDFSLSLIQAGDLNSMLTAQKNLEELGNYRDARGKLKELQQKIADARAAEEKKKNGKKLKIVLCLIAAIIVVVVIAVVVLNMITQKENQRRYESGLAHFENGEYEQAIDTFEILDDYKDSTDLLEKSQEGLYEDALAKFNSGDFNEAVTELELIKNYKDVAAILEQAGEEASTLNAIMAETSITDELILQANELMTNAQYLKNPSFSEMLTKYTIFANASWKFDSGDLNAVSGGENEIYEIRTDLCRDKGWNYFQLNIWYTDINNDDKKIYFDGKMSDTLFKQDMYENRDYSVELVDEKTIAFEAEFSDGRILQGIYVKE